MEWKIFKPVQWLSPPIIGGTITVVYNSFIYPKFNPMLTIAGFLTGFFIVLMANALYWGVIAEVKK